MRVLSLVALGITAYGAFLLASMPASFLLERARQAQPGKFEFREAGGTAWRGNAKATVSSPGGPLQVERIEWRWLPGRLASGRFAFDIAAAAPGIRARYEGARTLTSWEVTGLEVRGDAQALGALVPWLAAWRPEGVVTITSPRLATDGAELRGEARFEWTHAAVSLSEVRPLGSYRADIVAEGHAGRVKVTTLEGALQFTGQGTLTPPARITFSGQARGTGEQAKALEPLLGLLGPARADGARAISWQAP